MDILGDRYKPGRKGVVFVESINFIEGLRECLDRNIFRFVLVPGFFQLKTIYIVPVSIQKIIEGRLTSVFCLPDLFKEMVRIYFQCFGFEMRLAIKIANCVNIKKRSKNGNNHTTSRSFSFCPALKYTNASINNITANIPSTICG